MLPSSPSLIITDPVRAATGLSSAMPPLHAGEIVLSVFEPDLNGAMQFSASTLLLTSERMISDSGGGGWTSWPLKAALSLHHSDHAGVGTLALHDGQDCVMRWRFTLAIDVAAVRLMQVQMNENTQVTETVTLPVQLIVGETLRSR